MDRKILLLIIAVAFIIIGVILAINPTVKKYEIELPDGSIREVEIKLWDYLYPFLEIYIEYRLISASENTEIYERFQDIRFTISDYLEDRKFQELIFKIGRRFPAIQVCVTEEIETSLEAYCVAFVFYDTRVLIDLRLSTKDPTIIVERDIFDLMYSQFMKKEFGKMLDTFIEAYRNGEVKLYNTNLDELISALA